MPDAPATAPYVFLSYARADHERAQALAAVLAREGISLWLDRTSIDAGTSWGAEIVEGIEGCAALVLLCSEAAMQSRNVKQEVQLAWRYERPYVPVLLESVEFPQQVQYFLEGWQWVEAADRAESEWLPQLLKALARLGVAGQRPDHSESSATAGGTRGVAGTGPAQAAADPRRAIVGRTIELDALRAALDRAIGGEGRLMLLVGEPGIGKTRLAQALAAEAGERGALVLWGRCWEGEGAPAFWPWTEALGSWARGEEPAALRRALGPAAAELAQLVPAIRAQLPDLPPPPPADPESARFRLFGGVTALLTGLALERPVVLVLDDLHWADKPSLLLLQFLARELGGSRLLVVGTYRDTDLDRKHPLAEALVGLRREPVVERMALGGLSADEVAGLMAARAGHPLDAEGRRLAATLHRETEGNPFFVDETLRHLAESGALRQEGGRWLVAEASVEEVGIPEGVREVIGRRLSRLSEPCNALLPVAAVIGREFDADILERVSGQAADAVDEALIEATRAAVLSEVGGAAARYRFGHALIRETLLRELPTRRRLRLHGAVGEALEAHYGVRAGRHAGELAYHFAEAGSGDQTLKKAVAYSVTAAEQAAATLAWEEAVRHYERALELLEGLDGEAMRRAHLSHALGKVLGDVQVDLERVVVLFGAAISTFDRAERRLDAASARLDLAGLLTDRPEVRDFARATDALLLAERDLQDEPESPMHRRLNSIRSRIAVFQMQTEAALAGAWRALAVAERSGDPVQVFESTVAVAGFLARRGEVTRTMTTLEPLWQQATQVGGAAEMSVSLLAMQIYSRYLGDHATALSWFERQLTTEWTRRAPGSRTFWTAQAALQRLELGEVARATAIMEEIEWHVVWADLWRAMFAYRHGRWPEAAAAFDTTIVLARDLDDVMNECMYSLMAVPLHRDMADYVHAERLALRAHTAASAGGAAMIDVMASVQLAHVYAATGRPGEARRFVERARSLRPADEDWRVLGVRMLLADAVTAAAEGEIDAASTRFAEALTVLELYEHPWLAADTHHEWGVALRRAGRDGEARAHFDAARTIYVEHGAGQAWLDRVDAAVSP